MIDLIFVYLYGNEKAVDYIYQLSGGFLISFFHSRHAHSYP